MQALAGTRLKSRMLHQTVTALNRLGDMTQIEIKWIKAHIGLKGNEEADREAKKGTNLSDTENIPLPKSVAKDRIKSHIYGKKDGELEKRVTLLVPSYLN